MSALGDAVTAVKAIILIEERVKTQGEKLEKLADLVVGIDRRLVRVETTLDIAMRHAAAAPPQLVHQPSTASAKQIPETSE